MQSFLIFQLFILHSIERYTIILYNWNITIGGLPKVVRLVFAAGMPPFLLLSCNFVFKQTYLYYLMSKFSQ